MSVFWRVRSWKGLTLGFFTLFFKDYSHYLYLHVIWQNHVRNYFKAHLKNMILSHMCLLSIVHHVNVPLVVEFK